jgi:hypothetical protein
LQVRQTKRVTGLFLIVVVVALTYLTRKRTY